MERVSYCYWQASILTKGFMPNYNSPAIKSKIVKQSEGTEDMNLNSSFEA